MIIGTEYFKKEYQRASKLGKTHSYYRHQTILIIRCDKCGIEFTRERGSMSPKRIDNNVYHVCNCCDSKRFAQEKGVESRHIWDMPVSSLKTLDQL